MAATRLDAGAIALLTMMRVLRSDGAVIGFVAYVCSNASNRVGAYSLLAPTDYPTTGQHHKIEIV